MKDLYSEDHYPCAHCDPELFTTEVDIYFLKIVENAFKQLEEQAPDHYASGWGDSLQEHIKKALVGK